jgi:cell division protein FtsW (lipid II flippase)
VEFQGLKSQYLFLFAGGLLAVFVVFVILYMAGVNQWACIAFGVVVAGTLVYLTFSFNAKYGEHGLMKLMASRQHPRFLINRKNSRRLFTRKRKGVAHA